MKKFWENYKQNLTIMMDFNKAHWKAFAVICFVSSLIAHIANIILSLYVIDPKYYLGENRFLPPGGVVIVMFILIEIATYKYLQHYKNKQEHFDSE